MSSSTSDAFSESRSPTWRASPHLWVLGEIGKRLRCGTLTVITPEPARLVYRGAAPGPDGVVVLHRWRGLRRLLLKGDLGFAEAYLDGDWSSPDLAAMLELGARNLAPLSPAIDGAPTIRLLNRAMHRLRANTLAGSRRNIRQHYDLGNEFYERWLDTGMSYSSGLFLTDDTTLEQAQEEKQARVLSLLDVFPGHSVLEIGCGWGGLAERLARRGCDVTGITLSPAQLAYARERTGAARRVDLRLQDYRETSGKFDRVVSIEMLEAVGEKFWPRYFDTLHARLRPGGVAVLQVITIDDARFESYRRTADFIQRYIFPGGMLPPPSAVRRHIEASGLVLRHVETFGESYARTLVAWRERFTEAWPAIAALGFSGQFRKMWDFYLCYCEAGFRAGAIDVGLWQIVRPE